MCTSVALPLVPALQRKLKEWRDGGYAGLPRQAGGAAVVVRYNEALARSIEKFGLALLRVPHVQRAGVDLTAAEELVWRVVGENDKEIEVTVRAGVVTGFGAEEIDAQGVVKVDQAAGGRRLPVWSRLLIIAELRGTA